MAPDQEFTRARLSLSVFTQKVFNETKVLDARDWQIFAGIGRYMKTAFPPGDVKDKARATRLGILSKYATLLQKEPSATSDGQGGISSFKFFKSADQIPPSQLSIVPAFLTRRRADLVWDDVAELGASEFPYTSVATELTPSVRARVYGQTLSEVQPPAENTNTGLFDNGSQFYAAAATKATYDLTNGSQPYYPKWREPRPVKSKDRQYGFDALSDRYLQLNYLPYDLEKGFVHLYLQVGPISVLAKLLIDDKGQLQHEGIFGRGVPQYGNYFGIVNQYIAGLKAKNQKVRGTASFVYSYEGAARPPKFFQQEEAISTSLSLNVMEQVVDPQAVVQEARGLEIDAIDLFQKRWTPRDWLREMVRLRFSAQWIWFWKNSYVEMFYQIDRDRLFLNDLREAIKKAPAGPLRQTLEDFIKKAVADPNLYLVKRGSHYGPDKRVMGSDDSYVYFYNNKTRLVTRVPMFIFWRDQNVSQISKDIYDSTKGMIPITKVIVWGGLAVATWEIIGTEAIVNGFRRYVGEYIADRFSGAAIQKLIEETFKRFKGRILALLILPVLDILGKKLLGQTPTGRKIFAFLEGFAEGFTEHAFQAIIARWQSLLNFEPASYRVVKLLIRIEGILAWVDEKMSALKDYLNAKVAETLSHRFVAVTVEAGTALIALIDNLYFLDYKQAKGFLELYAELAEVKVPTEADWNRWRHRHLLETFRNYKEEITRTGKDIAELYNDVQQAVETARTVVKRTEYVVGAVALTNAALAGGLAPLMMLSLKKIASKVGSSSGSKRGKVVAAGAGVAVAGGFVAELILNDDFAADVVDFIGSFGKAASALGSGVAATADFTWATPERMQRFGQLVGVVVASVVISRTVIKSGDWQKRWESRKGYFSFLGKETLRRQFRINPLLPGLKLALFHYVRLVEEVVADSHTLWAEFEGKVEKILLGNEGDPLWGIVDEDKGITLPKLISILKLADALLLKWLKQLAAVPGLTEQISFITDKLASLGPSEVPSLEQIRDGSMSEVDWLKEALMYVMLTHLQGGINILIHSLQSMLEPVNPDDPTPASVGFVMQTLGFNLQETDALEALDRNFDTAFPDQTP